MANGSDSSGEKSSDGMSDAELKRRHEALEAKLNRHEIEEQKAVRKEAEVKDRTGLALALRLSSEFVAGIAVGAGFGYAIDTYFGTTPWAMILFLLLGFAAAVLNIMRATGKVAESPLHLHKAGGSEQGDGPNE